MRGGVVSATVRSSAGGATSAKLTVPSRFDSDFAGEIESGVPPFNAAFSFSSSATRTSRFDKWAFL